MKKLAIVGGGASGLAAAVSAAQVVLRAHRQGVPCDGDMVVLPEGENLAITVFEADNRVGKSILRSGNGRCNYSNSGLWPRNYRSLKGLYWNNEFVEFASCALLGWRNEVKGKLSSSARLRCPVTEFLTDLGLYYNEDEQGRLYPYSNMASSVLDVLRMALSDLGVNVVCDSRVTAIECAKESSGVSQSDAYHLRFADGRLFHADAVILASGAKGSFAMQLPSDLQRVPLRPVLGPLRVDQCWPKNLNGCRVRCSVELKSPRGKVKAHEEGEVQFRDYGVSGIAVFNLSRFAAPGDTLLLNLLKLRLCDAEQLLFSRRKRMASLGLTVTPERLLSGLVLPRLAEVLLRLKGISATGCLERSDIVNLAEILCALPLTVAGIAQPDHCQAVRGGLCVEGFNPWRMESKTYPSFFACGETLDVDAACGGYNLHWAWTSGILAGCFAAKNLVVDCADKNAE